MLSHVLTTAKCSTLVPLSWLAASLCAFTADAAQKPVRQVEIHGDGIQPPESVDELWEKSAVVVDGRVVEVRPANRTFTPTVSVPRDGQAEPVVLAGTDYVIQILRLLKSDGVLTADASTVIVRRLGGTVDRGAYVAEVVDSGFAKFKHQSRYVLFLKPSRGDHASAPVYFPAVGADSAFELQGDRVVPLGRAVASQRLADLGVEQLVASLATRGGK